MTVDQFIEKWWDGHRNITLGKDLMRADLEEMLNAARKDLTLQEAMDMLQDL